MQHILMKMVMYAPHYVFPSRTVFVVLYKEFINAELSTAEREPSMVAMQQ
jgi:hypothetical protein